MRDRTEVFVEALQLAAAGTWRFDQVRHFEERAERGWFTVTATHLASRRSATIEIRAHAFRVPGGIAGAAQRAIAELTAARR